MIVGLAHVCFDVKDLEASIRFYQEQLGLRTGFEFRNTIGERFGIYFHVGERTFLELFQADDVAPAGKPSFQHICLEVDDINATVTQLRANGVTVSDPELGSDQSWQAWLADPDGNKIELHGYTGESKQLAALK